VAAFARRHWLVADQAANCRVERVICFDLVNVVVGRTVGALEQLWLGHSGTRDTTGGSIGITAVTFELDWLTRSDLAIFINDFDVFNRASQLSTTR
jgi:hypothetical protein